MAQTMASWEQRCFRKQEGNDLVLAHCMGLTSELANRLSGVGVQIS